MEAPGYRPPCSSRRRAASSVAYASTSQAAARIAGEHGRGRGGEPVGVEPVAELVSAGDRVDRKAGADRVEAGDWRVRAMGASSGR